MVIVVENEPKVKSRVLLVTFHFAVILLGKMMNHFLFTTKTIGKEWDSLGSLALVRKLV